MESDHTTLETEMHTANSSLHEQFGFAMSIVYHADLSRIGERCWLSSLTSNGDAEISRLSPMFYSPNDEHVALKGRPIEDLYVSRKPIKVSLDGNEIRIESKKDVLVNGEENHGLPVNIGQGVLINIANRVLLLLHLQKITRHSRSRNYELLGYSDNITEVRNQIEKVANLDVPVLIRGESGTGKELIANAIAQHSHRNHMPFVVVNMAAVTSSLASSELFGTSKGAFTGATTSRKGYFEQANNGTLFLDEIGEAAEEIQTALLRAIESGEIQPVGSSAARKVDVRLISATDANLESKIDKDTFKHPLLQRLAGYEIILAPLRERRSDIGILMAYFLREEFNNISEELVTKLPAEIENLCAIFQAFVLYHWPGNVRELKNLTRQLVIDSRGEDSIILTSKLRNKLKKNRLNLDKKLRLTDSIKNLFSDNATSIKKHLSRRKPGAIGNDELESALRSCDWDIQAAAKSLHISRASLYNRIDEHPQLRRATDISQNELKQSYIDASGNVDEMMQMLKVSKKAIKRRLNEMPELKSLIINSSSEARQ